MKKVSITSFVLGLIGAALCVGMIYIPFTSGLFQLTDLLNNVTGMFGSLGVPQIVVLAVAGLALVLDIIMLIVSGAKGKVAIFILNIITIAVAVFAGATAATLVPDMFSDFTANLLKNIIYLLDTLIVAVAALLCIVGSIVLMCCKKEKEVEEQPVEEEVEEQPAEEQPAEEVVEEQQTEEPVAEQVVEPVAVEKVEEQKEEPTAGSVVVEESNSEPKVIRHILVHKSGRVVRVLNEHYYDVTTNIYYEPGVVYAQKPTITEAQHYEQIIGIAKSDEKLGAQEVAAPAPAPVEPAPAPVAPAPVPVVPAPAPAPVVEKVKVERIPFTVRMKKAEKPLKNAYNEIKSELLSYGVKSRVAISGDTFRLHTKTYAKITVAGKSLKLYFALNPKDYKDSTYPIGDASKKNLYKEIPLVFKVKSDLSVRRAKQLIADTMAKDGIVQKEVEKHDWVKEIKLESK